MQKVRSFAERFISFLIIKVFDNYGNGKKEHLSIRQHAWNYLVSLISREDNIIKPQVIVKCLQMLLKQFNLNYKKENELQKKSRSPSLYSSYS